MWARCQKSSRMGRRSCRQEKQSGERDAHHTHDDNGKDVCLDQVDGYFPSVAAFNLLERRLFLLDIDILFFFHLLTYSAFGS